MASVLAEHFGSVARLRQATVEELSEIKEIGPVIAQSVHEFLHGEFGKQALDALQKVGVATEAVATRTATQSLAGKTLVVTGKLTRYTRDEVEALIEAHGGRAASSVSSRTDYLRGRRRCRQQAGQSPPVRSPGDQRSGV